MRWSKVMLAGVVLGGAACAPTVHVTPLEGAFPPRRTVEELAVFSTRTPECPYQELAIVTAYQGELAPFTDLDGVLEALKEEAREMGADAVVGLRLVNRGGDSPRDGYTGTAIRFTDEGCMR